MQKEPVGISGDHTPIRIGLLTPYGGTNLGDGAIQAAAIEGIQRHLPGAELWGITLNPPETAKRHGISAFPITGLLVPYYSETLFEPFNGLTLRFSADSRSSEKHDNNEPTTSRIWDFGRIWKRIKQVPLLGHILNFLLGVLRKGLIVVHEIRHIGASFHFVRTLDMVIVSGGGQLDETWGRAWGHPYVLLRWALLTRLAGKKYVIFSVGVDEVRTGLSRFFIRTALSLASYRSYRDIVSKKLLEKWTFTSNDSCVPDLAFGLHVNPKYSCPLARAHSPCVGISPMAFGRSGSWPKPAPAVYRRYLSCLAEFTASLVEKGYRVVFFKSSGIDRHAIEDLQSMIVQSWPANDSKMISVSMVETVEEFFKEVKKVDLVVATRLHGVILSHLLEKPVVAISYDRKVGTHMRDVGQGEYVLDLNSFNAAELMNSFQRLENDSEEIRETLRSHVSHYRATIEKQYEHLSRLLKSARGMEAF